MNVLTLGTFDLFHAGHVRLLERCRLLAGTGQVVVALNQDEFVERYKGRAPVISYRDRAIVVRACRYVDSVAVNPQEAPGDSIATLLSRTPTDAIVIGSDWRDRDYLGQTGLSQPDLDALGIIVIYVPYTEGISSSRIREAVA